MSKIPGQIVDFSLYNQTEKLIGHGAEVTLPKITSKTFTADLAAGEIDLPGMRTENLEIEIPFNIFDKEAAKNISLTHTTQLTLRGSGQRVNTASHDFDYVGVKVVVKGFAKEVDLGTLKRSDKMDSKITMTLTYISVEDGDGNVFIKIDKLNSVFIVNNENIRKDIDKYL